MGSECTSSLFISNPVYHESKRQSQVLPGKKCLETVGEQWITVHSSFVFYFSPSFPWIFVVFKHFFPESQRKSM